MDIDKPWLDRLWWSGPEKNPNQSGPTVAPPPPPPPPPAAVNIESPLRLVNSLGPGPTVAVAGGSPLENGWGHGAAVRDARLIKPVWAGASHPVGDAAPPSPPAPRAVVPVEEERREEGWRGEEEEVRTEGKDGGDMSGDGGIDDVFDMELMVSTPKKYEV